MLCPHNFNGAFFPFADKFRRIPMLKKLSIITGGYKNKSSEKAVFFYGTDIAHDFGLQ
jgi:hypothetical protein